jgi:hypothetical protein
MRRRRKLDIRRMPVTRPGQFSVPGHVRAPAISGSEGACKIQLPEGSAQKAATILALDFPANPEIQSEAAKP